MTKSKWRVAGLHPAIWMAIEVAVIIGLVVITVGMFNRDFRPYARVTLTTDRAGLVMETDAKVKMRGVQIGRVSSIQLDNPVRLELELYPEQLKYIPANVEAQIAAPTAFGAKFVELLPPQDPSPKRLAAGAVVQSRNVSIEVNTVFQNLVDVLNQVDTAKLNAVLSALAEGFQGKGEGLGGMITDLNEVLTTINPRSETMRENYRSLKAVADTYGTAAPDILTTVDAVSTTSATITNSAEALDSLLLNLIGLSRTGIDVIGRSKDDLVNGVNTLEPTVRLLRKYDPELTCTLVGAKKAMDMGWGEVAGGHNGKSIILDVALLPGDDAYRYPDNLPINGAKGGPGGEPSCGSLPDVSKNWPQRYLVTDTGWGTGLDVRPNPGIGFPGWANYFPVTRAVPEPPSIRNPGGPAPGPIPYPGAPPYGAALYGPDGTPLYPGLPPAPEPGRPRDPGPPPQGAEPFQPAHPGAQPTPLPPIPAPVP
ncbi:MULTISPECIES: MCE family protein [Mycolicibacterium]|uniref:MCE family protein n=1 Tax=Mycolicibacterium TaxID=1866885 RepID=UPI00149066CB|nr:MCE family protein [Mycolicibacterium fortuitum]